MKVLVCVDSFKNSITSDKANEAIKKGILAKHPSFDVECFSISDGGEGALAALSKLNDFEKIELKVTNSNLKKINAFYLIKDNIAFIESSLACGIQQISNEEKNPISKTTYGVGEMIKDAISKKVKRIYLTVGGTCTNDGGIGLLSALGIKFLSKDNKELLCMGGALPLIDKIDSSNMIQYNGEIIVATDVKNTLLGKNGATKIYARQKGASDSEIDYLERGMRSLAKILNNKKEKIVGMGAGGGIPYGILSFYNGRIISGFDLIAKFGQLEEKIKNADLIITGEGKIDKQTLFGKVPYCIAKLAKDNNKKIIAVCGINELKKQKVFNSIYSLNDKKATKEELLRTYTDLYSLFAEKVNI